jgi:hypothetical protein
METHKNESLDEINATLTNEFKLSSSVFLNLLLDNLCPYEQ